MLKYLVSTLAALCATAALVGAENPPLNYRMGVSTHFAHKTPWMYPWDAERHIPMIAELGVGWIRDEILWREVEPTPGNYQLSERTRKWVDIANAHGLKIIAIFADRNQAHKDQFDPDAYAAAAAWLAKELDGKIHAIEVLNEPFGSDHFTGGAPYNQWTGLGPDGKPVAWLSRYVTIVNKAADAIKAANPRMTVIGLGSVAPQNYRMISMGLSPNLDGLTDHPYSFRVTPEVLPHRDTPAYRKQVGFPVADSEGTYASFVRMYREHLAKHNGPEEIWFTESGWSTFREGDKNRTYMYSAFTEHAQAAYVQRRFVESLALDVTVNIHYDFLDDHGHRGGDFNAEAHFGLVRKDDSLKPSYHAVQNVARATVGFSAGSAVEAKVFPFSNRTENHPVNWDGGDLPALSRIMCYPFTDAEGRPVFAVWSAERIGDLNTRAADLELSIDPDAYVFEAIDLMSGEIYRPEVRKVAGRAMLESLAVPPHPVLIRVLPISR